MTPAVREFLVRLSELLGREVPVTEARDTALARCGDLEIEVDDRAVIVRYSPEQIRFTSRDEALRFIEMVRDGRVELEVARGVLWTTIRSYRDGLALPFRRTRMPWITLRPRSERRRLSV
ncbi:MAG TPA: hypothetical protein VFR41_08505 [Acidimicrobiia bacterium]|nr:hypothetical protein [Acidimicrobiia bacterium]